MVIRVGTDCSGIEAPIVALHKLKIPFVHEFSCDNDPYVKKTIFANFEPNQFYENIFNRDHSTLPDIDLYVCGFPCQPFSTNSRYQLGFEDKNNRGIIFFECYNTIKAKTPKVFILENVRGLLNHKKGKTFETIKQYLSTLPYNIYYNILNSYDFELPQDRVRVYIVGIHKSIEKKVLKKISFDYTPKHKNLTKILDVSNVGNKENLFAGKRVKKLKILEDKIKEKNIVETDDWVIDLNTSGGSYTTSRLNKSPCLITCCFMYYITSLQRFLTIREVMRLQGFPDDFNIVVGKIRAFKQCGNSMSVNVLEFLFTQIIKVF